VGVFARRATELDRLVSDGPNGRVAPYVGDVRDAAALACAAADFVARFGAPDIVIANAGISQGTLTEHAADLQIFRAVLETNVQGMVHTFQPFLAAMKAARRGTLAGIASVAGFRGLPGAGAYSASKAAAITYLESLRVELRGSGIAVVTICPGYVATPMTARNPYRMPFLPMPTGRRASRARDRAPPLLLRAAMQMALVGRAARAAAPALRRAVCARPAQAAAPRLTGPELAATKRAALWRALASLARGPRLRASRRYSDERIPTVIAQ
jgi:NAD(P)-dependent dehydrogenase (short-subunit alcohol dehydrogenase family)